MSYDSKRGGKLVWTCGAIDNGVTVFPNGKIGPCCRISADYLKPVSEIANPKRFFDLKTETPPPQCSSCIKDEEYGIRSTRMNYNQKKTDQDGIQFLDLRNTNLCNLKCRYCGPHYSSQWAKELENVTVPKHQDILPYQDLIITKSLQYVYFTGGEPMINKDHWALLSQLVDRGLAKNIDIRYNTNLTTLKYKDVQVIDLWKNFKSVQVDVSIDAIGEPLSYIRSGADWETIKQNVEMLLAARQELKLVVNFTPVLSIMNIWFVNDLLSYAKNNNIGYFIYLLYGPDYLSLSAMPDSLKESALSHVDNMETNFHIPKEKLHQIRDMIKNNDHQYLFKHTLSHITLLDNLRGEKLFELLPFKNEAFDQILKNHEYQ